MSVVVEFVSSEEEEGTTRDWTFVETAVAVSVYEEETRRRKLGSKITVMPKV